MLARFCTEERVRLCTGGSHSTWGQWIMGRRGLVSAVVQFILVVALGTGAWFAYDQGVLASALGSSEGSSQRRGGGAVGVTLAEVTLVPQQTVFETVATAEAARSITLRAKAEGIIESIPLDPGAKVAQAQTILTLDTRTQTLAVERAQVALAAAQTLASRFRGAGQTMVDGTALIQAESSLALAEVELRQARQALADRTVVAPFTGYVGMSALEVGDRVNAQDVIATLDDRSQLILDIRLPETLLAQVGVGTAVTVQPWVANAPPIEGALIALDSRLDPVTRSIAARVRIDNPEDALRPGMSFRVRLDVSGERFPQVPEVAVQWGVDGALVWVVKDGTAARLPVAIVERQQGVVLLDAPLNPGDLVVVEGIQRMRPGAAVKVASTPLPAEPVEASIRTSRPQEPEPRVP